MNTIDKATAAITNDGSVTCLEVAVYVATAVPLLAALLIAALVLGGGQ
jgi:hypothetical protein